MRSPKLVLAGAVTGAAAVALATLFAVPASAAVTGPNSSECINATTLLSNARAAQAAAQSTYNADVKARDTALDTYNAAIADNNPSNDAPALAVLNHARSVLDQASVRLNARIHDTDTAQTAVDTACASTTTPAPTTTPVPVGLPAPTPAPVIVYKFINGQKCKCVNGGPCIPVPAPPPAPVAEQAPVTIPGPVIQGAPTYIPGPIVSVPNTSAGVNNGDGSTADDTITVTIDLGNILDTVPSLPALPKV